MTIGKVLITSVTIFGKAFIPEDDGVEIMPGGIISEPSGYLTNGSPIPAAKVKGSELKITLAKDSSYDHRKHLLLGQSGIVQIIYKDSSIETFKECMIKDIQESVDGKITITFAGNAFIDTLTA